MTMDDVFIEVCSSILRTEYVASSVANSLSILLWASVRPASKLTILVPTNQTVEFQARNSRKSKSTVPSWREYVSDWQ